MLHSEGSNNKVNRISYDEVTDISESLDSEIRENSPLATDHCDQEYKGKENFSSTACSLQNSSTMSDFKMAGDNSNPNRDDTEVVPFLTQETDETPNQQPPFQEDEVLDVIPVNDIGNVGNFGVTQQPDLTQTPPPPHFIAGNLTTLSSEADHFQDQFPDASDAISFNIADEQTEEEEDEHEPSGPSGPLGPSGPSGSSGPLAPTNFAMSAPMKAGVGPMEGPHNALPTPHIDSPGGNDDDEDDDDDDDDVQAPLPEGSYDPGDYANLDVPPELKELFNYISNYTPQNIELEHKLRPFIPDYIPAVGDIDAFIKIPRPDEEASTIGLTVLDEPSAKQSDATVLDLQLRAVAKHTTAKSVVVKTVENAEKNGKIIEKWTRDISDLHRAKPPPTVHYSKQMPDIDSLMQEWPGEIEELLKEISLPSAELQVELPHYVDLICSILDIPVYKSRIQSLHVFFTLYSVFKNSAHFRHLAEENIMEDDSRDQEADRLVL